MKRNCLDLSQYLSQFKNPESEWIQIPSIPLIYHVEHLHRFKIIVLYSTAFQIIVCYSTAFQIIVCYSTAFQIIVCYSTAIVLFVSISNENPCYYIVVKQGNEMRLDCC
jgi:hypothetical protein